MRFPRFVLMNFALACAVATTGGAHAQNADPHPADAEIAKQVAKIFATSYAEMCTSISFDTGPAAPDVWDFTYTHDYDPEYQYAYRLFRFHCFNGAYNELHTFYGVNHYGEIEHLQFAAPTLHIVHEDMEFEAPVTHLSITGMRSDDLLVNSSVDPETGMISSFSKWRGIGDASSSGEWSFDEGEYVLTRYDVDPTYDGEFESFTVWDPASNAENLIGK